MSAKQVLFRSLAREKVLRGATQLADAVRITLGPKSKSVLIQKQWGAPIVCNDGVTIAKEMELEDREENLGAQMLRVRQEGGGRRQGHGGLALVHALGLLPPGQNADPGMGLQAFHAGLIGLVDAGRQHRAGGARGRTA